MTKLTYKTLDGKTLATGILGQDVLIVEGYHYFKREAVDLTSTLKEEKAYHCPIKNSDCDYYFLLDENSEKEGQEIAWIYPTINNSLFEKIAGMVGFYSYSRENLDLIKEEV